APADFWTVDLFKRELTGLLEHLGIASAYTLLGQSWGGMLAMEHALDHPDGLKGMVVANSPASIPVWVEEANLLRSDLPAEVQETLLRHEADGTTDDPDYEAAVMVFYKRHLCRVPWPECMDRAFAKMEEDPTVYHTMNGPSEFHCIGSLKNWDITDRLPEIDIPTLLISGEFDEATPKVVKAVADRIPGSEWVLFEGASHSTHIEEPERFVRTVEGFLDRL
ncbi:MAG: proline iminopeptidase-family hydrolase, partial [Actinobacteria bacterium]|nr:proline iminopeptidase-family hydrolase [Actinomycetota bacterium]